MAAIIQNSSGTVTENVDALTRTINASSGSNRFVLAIFEVLKSTTPPTLTSTPTYDGVAMTKMPAASDAWNDPLSDYKQGRRDVYYILEPNITNGTGFNVIGNYDADFDQGHLTVHQMKDAFQGTPEHFIAIRAADEEGPISGTIKNTVTGSLIVGHLNSSTTEGVGRGRATFTITGEVDTCCFSSTGGVGDYQGMAGTSADGSSDANVAWVEISVGTPVKADVRVWLTEINDVDFVGLESLRGLPVKIIPFVFSRIDAYIIEFGVGYFRFYTNGGIVEA